MAPFRSIFSLFIFAGLSCAVSAKQEERIFAVRVLVAPAVGLIPQSSPKTLTLTTPAGTQSWTYNAFGGIESWTVGGMQQFEVTQTDLLGRPLEIVDNSGVREIVYDNDTWTLDSVEWTAGPLQGYKLDEDADSRGRLGTLTVSKDLDDLYTVAHAYRGESDRIDTLTITAPGISVEIDINGPGGKADELIYKIGGQPTFTYQRTRNANGRMTGITAPGFSQSWTLDEMGRVDVLTTNGRNTDYGYDPVNGSLASAVSAEGPRGFTFTDRGELAEELISGETLAMIADLNQSGAATQRENLRKLTLTGTFHTNAVVNVHVGTNVVYNTAVTPFTFTIDETNLPALADTNAVVSLDWSVVGTRPEEPGGTPYEGGNAIAEIAGRHMFAPQSEPILYDLASRRSSDAFLNYGWNAANQALMLEERHGPHRVENVYDGSQRRIEKRVYENGNLRRTHRFVYDGWLPVVEEVLDQWGNLDYRNLYVYGPGPDGARRPGLGATGQLALIIHQPAARSPQLSAPIYNHRLDIVSLIDVVTGNVVARYEYTPFGETTYAEGSRADQNPFRFAGAYHDEETDTYYFGYRHYHPRTKLWISRDPIGEAGGLNLFAYANNDPINFVDYLGLQMRRGSALGQSLSQQLHEDSWAWAKPWKRSFIAWIPFRAIPAGFGDLREDLPGVFRNAHESAANSNLDPVSKAVTRGSLYLTEPLAYTSTVSSEIGMTAPLLGPVFAKVPQLVAPTQILGAGAMGYGMGTKVESLTDAEYRANYNLSEATETLLLGFGSFKLIQHQFQSMLLAANRSDYLVSFMGKNGIKYYDQPGATLGGRGGSVWLSPIDDVARISHRAGVVTGTGHAPGPLRSYLRGESIFGIAVPRNSVNLRLPTAADAGANRHFRLGGFTGVEHNGVWRSSNVHEFIIDGGNPVPQGSVFFEFGVDGSWLPIRRF